MSPYVIAIIALLLVGLICTTVATVRRLKKGLYLRRQSQSSTDPTEQHNCRIGWYAHLADSMNVAIFASTIGLCLWAVPVTFTDLMPSLAFGLVGFFFLLASFAVAVWASIMGAKMGPIQSVPDHP